VRAYEAYWPTLEAGGSQSDAIAKAQKLCPANMSATEFEKLITNKITAVNEITKARGTFRPNPAKRFSKLQKTIAAKKCA
jgi:hypothetical protein